MESKAEKILLNNGDLNAGLKKLLVKYAGIYTSSQLIYRYAVYYNNEYIKGACSAGNKDLYLSLIKNLLKELSACGFNVGAAWKDASRFPMAKGNTKLGVDTVILNVGAAVTCPSKNTNKCRVCGICYAENAERQYISSLIYRLNQALRFNTLSAEDIAVQVLRRSKIKFMRFNESGDLFDAEDIIKIRRIAEIIYNKKGIITYLYTAAGAEFKAYQTAYLKINISGRDYKAVPNLKDADGVLYCDGDCQTCLWCKYEFGLPVHVKYHGTKIPEGTGQDLRSAGVKYYASFMQYYTFFNHEYICKYGAGYKSGVAVTAGGD